MLFFLVMVSNISFFFLQASSRCSSGKGYIVSRTAKKCAAASVFAFHGSVPHPRINGEILDFFVCLKSTGTDPSPAKWKIRKNRIGLVDNSREKNLETAPINFLADRREFNLKFLAASPPPPVAE